MPRAVANDKNIALENLSIFLNGHLQQTLRKKCSVSVCNISLEILPGI